MPSGFVDYDDAYSALDWIEKHDTVFYTDLGKRVTPVVFRQVLELSLDHPDLSPLADAEIYAKGGRLTDEKMPRPPGILLSHQEPSRRNTAGIITWLEVEEAFYS